MYDDLSPLSAHPELPHRPTVHPPAGGRPRHQPRGAPPDGPGRPAPPRPQGRVRRRGGRRRPADADPGASRSSYPRRPSSPTAPPPGCTASTCSAPATTSCPPPVEVFQLPGNTRVRTTATSGGERTLLAPRRRDRARRPRDDAAAHGPRPRPAHPSRPRDRRPRRPAPLGRFELVDLLREVERFRGQRGVVQLRELAPARRRPRRVTRRVGAPPALARQLPAAARAPGRGPRERPAAGHGSTWRSPTSASPWSTTAGTGTRRRPNVLTTGSAATGCERTAGPSWCSPGARSSTSRTSPPSGSATR